MQTRCFGLLPFCVQDGELEFGADLGLVALDQQQVQRQVVLGLLVQTLWVDPKTPLQLVIWASTDFWVFNFFGFFGI